MNRIFHARILWYQYFMLAVFSFNALSFLWCKNILFAVVMMVLLVIVIEQIIHTQYIVTSEGEVQLFYGRFIRKKMIPIREITSVQRYHSVRFGRFSLTHYVLIEYGNRKTAWATPVKEQEFVEYIEKQRAKLKLSS